jgi:hypothetical protein
MTANDTWSTVRRRLAWGLVVTALAALIVSALLAVVMPPTAMHLPAWQAMAYNLVVFALWFAALVGSLAFMGGRILRHLRYGGVVPLLLLRDAASKLGMAVTVSLLITARTTLPAPADPYALSTWIPWMLWTTIPALLGMGTFFYFEAFVIKPGDDE